MVVNLKIQKRPEPSNLLRVHLESLGSNLRILSPTEKIELYFPQRPFSPSHLSVIRHR